MEKSFKQSVIEGLKSYVYVLVDPRDNPCRRTPKCVPLSFPFSSPPTHSYRFPFLMYPSRKERKVGK